MNALEPPVKQSRSRRKTNYKGAANKKTSGLIPKTDRQKEFLHHLKEYNQVFVLGPAGTGKTYLMAQICDALLRANYRVMVTALTNRALIELAEKEHLKDALQNGKVYKTSLTADEQKNKKINGIKALKNLKEQRPQMLLSTYYVMSQIATKALEGEHFDYIIVEEASQAFLSTIAMARKLGKKCIIIGDISQLEPMAGDVNIVRESMREKVIEQMKMTLSRL